MRACLVAYSFYENDNRVMRYAEALASRGDEVEVIALMQNSNPRVEFANGVTVYRIQKREINERGRLSYLFRMLGFLFRSAFFLSVRHCKRPYDLIHVHSVPDFEVFAAWIPKLLGAKVILDVHDIVPEFYVSKFNVGKDSFIFQALQKVEKCSAAFSDHVIIANHLWEKVITSRSVKKEKCSTFLNYPDSNIFHNALRTRKAGDKVIMIYPGTINWHQGLDIAVKAFDLVKNDIPEAEFHIYGAGSHVEPLLKMIAERGLQSRVKFMGGLPIKKVAVVMANADLGIVPKRNDSFGGDAFSTKIFEFMALGVPVIASKTRIDQFYFNDSLVRFFEPENEQSLAKAMLIMSRTAALRKEQAEKASIYVAQQSWDIKKKDYFDLVDRLVLGTNNKS